MNPISIIVTMIIIILKLIDYHTTSNCTGTVVGRVFVTGTSGEAHKQCFKALFDSVKKSDHSFKVGKTLKGIILDWSDAQLGGLKEVVGDDVASSVVKGCQVGAINKLYYILVAYTSIYMYLASVHL